MGNIMNPSVWRVFWAIAFLLVIENFVLFYYYVAHGENPELPVMLYDGQIDVVFTWCNGSDPNYLAQRKQLLAKLNYQEDTVNRFRYHEELRYSMRSVDTFAPWIRTIFIVSDEVPSFLNTSHPKVKMVPLKDIFTDQNNLPTYNSQAIESQLHHIPGLSEKFVYLNDDFFFNRPTTPATFLDGQLRHKVFLNTGKWIPHGQNHERPHVAAAQRANTILDNLFGRRTRYDHAHTPQLFDRSMLSMLEKLDHVAPLWNFTASQQFRSRKELQVQYLALHMLLETNQGIIVWTEGREQCHEAVFVAYCGVEVDKEYTLETLRIIERNHPLFFSMNDFIVDRDWDPEVEVAVHEFFERRFPHKASFEL